MTRLTVASVGAVTGVGSGASQIAKALAGQIPEPVSRGTAGYENYPPLRLLPAATADVGETIGKRGLRHLDRSTILTLLSCHQVLGDRPSLEADNVGTGVVIATTSGSIRSSVDFFSDTLTQEAPYFVDAARFPNTVMNSCASQVAIRNNLTGVNATISGGQTASLAAIRYGRSLLESHRAKRLVIGAVEELCEQTAWAWWHCGAPADTLVGEGSVVFGIETETPGARDGLATVVACEVAFHSGRSHRDGLAGSFEQLIRRALMHGGVEPADIAVVSSGSSSHPGLRRAEARALRAIFTAGVAPRRVDLCGVIGECYSANGAIQLAGLIAQWQESLYPNERFGLVTSSGTDGNIGCLIVERNRHL